MSWRTCRTSRPTRLPELAEVFGEFLASGRPVCFDAIAQLSHGPFDFKLILLQPRHIKLLAGSAALQLAVDILVIVPDNPTSRSA
jgi:hypothetical protein